MLARTARNALLKQPFTVRGCLNAIHFPSRPSSTLPASPDDTALVSLFDHPKKTFSPLSLSHTGIFGHPTLTTPSALIALADATLLRAQLLTERILRARESRDELFKVVKNLDRLSDMLCSVIDLAELVRNAHPDRSWVNSANETYGKLCEFMNVLNTHVGLYDVRNFLVSIVSSVHLTISTQVLKAVLSDPTIVKSLSPEAYQTALIFWRDFEKSAIDLPPEQRDRFVTLSSEILVLGRQFLSDATRTRQPAAIRPSELEGLKDKGMGTRLQLQAKVTQRDLMIYPGSPQAQMIMRSVPAEEPRRRVYTAAHTSSPGQIEVLERLLRARAELARLVGKESFADITLGDKMAKSPGQRILSSVLCTLSEYTSRECTAFFRRADGPYSTLCPKRITDPQHEETRSPQNVIRTGHTSLG